MLHFNCRITLQSTSSLICIMLFGSVFLCTHYTAFIDKMQLYCNGSCHTDSSVIFLEFLVRCFLGISNWSFVKVIRERHHQTFQSFTCYAKIVCLLRNITLYVSLVTCHTSPASNPIGLKTSLTSSKWISAVYFFSCIGMKVFINRSVID